METAVSRRLPSFYSDKYCTGIMPGRERLLLQRHDSSRPVPPRDFVGISLLSSGMKTAGPGYRNTAEPCPARQYSVVGGQLVNP